MRADWDGGAVAVCRVGGQRGAAPDTNADGSKHAQLRIEGRVLTDGDVEDVGLQLHQQLVGRHPAVHLQLRQPHAAVLVHGLHDLRDTQTHELQHEHMVTLRSWIIWLWLWSFL